MSKRTVRAAAETFPKQPLAPRRRAGRIAKSSCLPQSFRS
jgi:hypothetical protein